jgi:hypothetical protein
MIHGREPMSAHSKQILYDSVDIQETLSVIGRRESAHVTFPLSSGLKRRVGTIIRVGGRVVDDRMHAAAVRANHDMLELLED